MKAAVLGTGSELITGETMDTNSPRLATDLAAHGAEVDVTYRVADDLKALTREIAHALSNHDLLVTTGGLGPTPDDLTREAVARALGVELEFDPEVYQEIAAFFERIGRPMPEINKKQALRPKGAIWLENPRGTAPGFLWRDGKKAVVALPGPPEEWRPMWGRAKELLGLSKTHVNKKVFKTFGLGESDVYLLLGDLLGRHRDYEVATYAHADGVHVMVKGPEEIAKKVRKKLKKKIWGEDEDTLPDLVVRRLLAKNKTLSVMESVTGGLLAALLTDVPGVSKVFPGGVVSYSGEAKVRFGVSESVLKRYGAVSAETAKAMAEAARALLNSDFGLAVTGVAGPEPHAGQPVGTVYVGLATPRGSEARGYRFPDQGREKIRLRAAFAALAYFWSHP